MYYSHACRLKKSLNYPAYSRFNGYEVENSTSYHIMFKSSPKLVMTSDSLLKYQQIAKNKSLTIPSGSIYADADAEGVVEYRKEGKLPYRSPSTLRSSDATQLLDHLLCDLENAKAYILLL